MLGVFRNAVSDCPAIHACSAAGREARCEAADGGVGPDHDVEDTGTETASRQPPPRAQRSREPERRPHRPRPDARMASLLVGSEALPARAPRLAVDCRLA